MAVVAQLVKEEELAQKQSAFLIMNLLHYIGCQFPEKSFNDKNVPASDMKIKMLMPEDAETAESHRLIDWTEKGLYEALQKYLWTLLLSICEATNDLTVEENAISLSYPNAQSTKVCMIFNCIGNKRQGGTFKSNSTNEMKSSICQMIHTSVQLVRTLDKMPEKCTIVMKLLYFDRVICLHPTDLESPFISGPTDKVGNMSSKHFVLQHEGVLDPKFPKMTRKLLCYTKFNVSNVRSLLLETCFNVKKVLTRGVHDALRKKNLLQKEVKKSVLNPCSVDNEEKDLMEGNDMLVDSSSSDNDSGIGDFLSKADEYDPAGVWTADNDGGCLLNEYERDFFYIAPLDVAFKTIGIFVEIPSGISSSVGTSDEFEYHWIAETTKQDCLHSGSILNLKAHIRRIVDSVVSSLVPETYGMTLQRKIPPNTTYVTIPIKFDQIVKVIDRIVIHHETNNYM